MLQLLVIRNYSRRLIGFLRVNCVFIRFFDTGSDQTRTTKGGKLCDPTRPDLWLDPTRVQLGFVHLQCTIIVHRKASAKHDSFHRRIPTPSRRAWLSRDN